MPKIVAATFALLFPFPAIALVTSAQQSSQRTSPPTAAVFPLIGVWRGHSECVVTSSPCHDEINVYRISAIAGNSNEVHVVGAKIVDGKEVIMGTGDWQYDAAKHALESQTPAGSFHFNVDGGSMEGVLMLPDHSAYRRIHLKKDN